jgi:hypothetical protein
MTTKPKRLLIYSAALLVSLTNVKPTWAIPILPSPGGSSNQPIKFTLKNYGFTDLGPLITVLISLVLFFAGLLFLAYLLIGGLSWITSGGDPKAVAAARSRITNAFIGLTIVVATYAIILIVEKVFGINIVSGITFS